MGYALPLEEFNKIKHGRLNFAVHLKHLTKDEVGARHSAFGNLVDLFVLLGYRVPQGVRR